MPSIFPLEIEETILDLLAREDDRRYSALKMCSLVCQAFLHICRKHIFANIVLDAPPYKGGSSDSSPRPTTHEFERLLRETPEIADYIRTLDFKIWDEDLTNPSIQSLKRISKVEFLIVRSHCRNFEWSNNPIRPALLHLLHLPTLTHFTLLGIDNFVVSDLIPCVNLKFLEVDAITAVADETSFPAVFSEHSIQLNAFVVGIGNAPFIMKLCTAQRPDGQPIINFGSLSNITMGFMDRNESNEKNALLELFRHCPSLTNVDISCKWYLHRDHQDF